VEVVFGTSEPDVLTGSEDGEVLIGNGGADRLEGAGGPDVLYGGAGADDLDGGNGDDILRGDDATNVADTLAGGDGLDFADWGVSTVPVVVDLAAGTATGGDSMSGLEGIAGSALGDTLTGDAGPNIVVGREGADKISTAGGGDTVYAGADYDQVAGGAGDDRLEAEEDGGSADGGPNSDVCLDFGTNVACEELQVDGDGGGQPSSPAGDSGAEAPTSAARSAPDVSGTQPAPVIDWLAGGNPWVSCQTDLSLTSRIETRNPERVRPDYAYNTNQRIWLRQELVDLATPSLTQTYSEWYYTELTPSQWSTAVWYRYNVGWDNWTTSFPVDQRKSYAVIYDMWWQDMASGSYLFHGRYRPNHYDSDGVWYSDQCLSVMTGVVVGGYNYRSQCSAGWSDSVCAWYLGMVNGFNNTLVNIWLSRPSR
jgi:hypothetical protein